MAYRGIRPVRAIDERPLEEDEETTQQLLLAPQKEPTEPRDRCTLVMTEGDSPGRTIPLRVERMTLGRGSRADLRIDDPALSRVHAEIVCREGRWFVRDLGSTNGTWVGSSKIQALHPLSDGDRIKLGKTTTFKVALQNASEQKTTFELYESSVTDGLTRLHNRRYLDDRLEGEFAYASRHDTHLSILLIDVDHFKRINDTKGHPAGDAVLRVLGASLKRMTRTEDVVARYGGEEFAVVARGIDRSNALIFAERIRKLVEMLSIPWDGGQLKLTVSIGVATHRDVKSYESVADLLGAADRALYRAKNNGRNRCVPD